VAQLAIAEAIFNNVPQPSVGSLSINMTANAVASLQGTLANAADAITVYTLSVEPFAGITSRGNSSMMLLRIANVCCGKYLFATCSISAKAG
jgi:hypothetical protein